MSLTRQRATLMLPEHGTCYSLRGTDKVVWQRARSRRCRPDDACRLDLRVPWAKRRRQDDDDKATPGPLRPDVRSLLDQRDTGSAVSRRVTARGRVPRAGSVLSGVD